VEEKRVVDVVKTAAVAQRKRQLYEVKNTLVQVEVQAVVTKY
jgi:hypothetical protein